MKKTAHTMSPLEYNPNAIKTENQKHAQGGVHPFVMFIKMVKQNKALCTIPGWKNLTELNFLLWEKLDVFLLQPKRIYNFVKKNRLEGILVPMKTPWKQLSNGTGLMLWGFLPIKLWADKVYIVFLGLIFPIINSNFFQPCNLSP